MPRTKPKAKRLSELLAVKITPRLGRRLRKAADDRGAPWTLSSYLRDVLEKALDTKKGE